MTDFAYGWKRLEAGANLAARRAKYITGLICLGLIAAAIWGFTGWMIGFCLKELFHTGMGTVTIATSLAAFCGFLYGWKLHSEDNCW